MVGNIYKHYLKRIKVISKAENGQFNCLEWIDAKPITVRRTKGYLESKEFICNIL